MNSVFNKNILTLITGNAVAMAIPVLLYPVVSRIFTPEDYALFGLYAGIFGVLEIASAGRYDFAVILPKKANEAANIIGGALLFTMAYALLILLLVVFFRHWAADQLNNEDLANWLFLLPAALVFNSMGKLGNSWLIRQKRFKASSFNKAAQKISEVTCQMGLGAAGIGNGLIIGDTIGRFFNAAMSYYQSVRANFNVRLLNFNAVRLALIKYAEFPKYNTLPSMLNALASMIPVFIISSHYSTEISGSFNFSKILLSIPFALIAISISQVLMQQIAEKKHASHSIIHDLRSLAIKLGGLGLIGALLLFFVGPEIFAFIFGNEWRQAGEFTRILIFSNVISFVVSPYSVLLAVLGKIRYSGIWQTFYFVASCCLWFFSSFPIEKFLIFMVLIDMVCYFIYGVVIFVAVKNYEKHLADDHA